MRFTLLALALLVPALPGNAQVFEQLADGPAPGALFGQDVAPAGDLDGDGQADLLVRYRVDSQWWVRAVSGADGSTLFDVDPTPLAGTSEFALGLAGGGDLNGDGVPDLLIGDDGYDAVAPDGGAVFVLSGVDGSLIDTVHGEAEEYLGAATTFLGDLDGDGDADWATWVALYSLPFGSEPASEVRVYSGASSTLMATVLGSGTPFGAGDEIAGVHDLDGDGLRELAVTLTAQDYAPRVRVTSGASLAAGAPVTLWESVIDTTIVFDLGVAPLGDTDGDGVPDVLALSSPVGTSPGVGSGHVLSGTDGVELHRLEGVMSLGERFARSGAGLGDLDGDGLDDVAVGGTGTSSFQPVIRGPYVRLFSGATGDEILTLWSGSADLGAFSGVDGSLAAPGDVSGDGRADLAFGAVGGNSTAEGPTGRVYVFGFAGDWTWKGWSKPGDHGEPWLLAKGDLVQGAPVTLALGDAAPSSALFLVLGAPQASMPFKGGTLGPTPQLVLVDQTDALGGRSWSGTWSDDVLVGQTLLVQAWIDDGDGDWAASNTLHALVP